jgi:chaperonin GroEL
LVENPDQKTGVDIVRKAIRAPARQIIDNSGADGAVVVGKLLEAKEYGYGYDAQTGKYGDLVALGIIDPTKVVRTALQDAASIAGLIVTTEATITEHPKKEAPALPQGGGMGGLRRTRSLRQTTTRPWGFPRAFFMSARNPRSQGDWRGVLLIA